MKNSKLEVLQISLIKLENQVIKEKVALLGMTVIDYIIIVDDELLPLI